MRTAQYERILKALERTAELLQDTDRAKRAGRVLVYPSIEELQKDINELLEAFKRNRLFIVNIEDTMSGLILSDIKLDNELSAAELLNEDILDEDILDTELDDLDDETAEA